MIHRYLQVRFAWHSNPASTLFNGTALPAAPFRTDTWLCKIEEPDRIEVVLKSR
jgi:hypothetical protein